MRASGILMPIFSLPSPYGIGTLGKEAYAFVDFLKESKQTYWQVLPLGPTSYGDSPYQSFSTFAGNPYFIDLDMLKDDGLLTQKDIDSIAWKQGDVDYAFMYSNRIQILRKAFECFTADAMFEAYEREQSHWLPDYALFMALKKEQGDVSWLDWEESLKKRESNAIRLAKKRLAKEMDFHIFLQYMFASQWHQLRSYANKHAIQIIGDVPIYVALDSADTWMHPELFLLDKQLTPTFVAGCPPDYFSKTGQLWGNPLFDWKRHEQSGFAWWVSRIEAAFRCYNVLRIDHFRGFASFYAIPHGHQTAEFGHWEAGPGMLLFNALRKQLGKLNIIAEDLGFLTKDVFKLLKDTGFPGMRVLQFAFTPYQNSMYLPHNYIRKCIAYTGTHDNTTSSDWYLRAPRAEKRFAQTYLMLTKREGISWGLIRGIFASAADTAIAPMQDFLSLGAQARINTPSTLGGNWQWRMDKDALTASLAEKIKELTMRYGRASE